MNKKFLSAILFGALMITSTGTFVSCKDYDDDIKDLQEQIDKKASLEEMSSKIALMESDLASCKSTCATNLATAKAELEKAVDAAAKEAAAAKVAAAEAEAKAIAAAEAKVAEMKKALEAAQAEFAAGVNAQIDALKEQFATLQEMVTSVVGEELASLTFIPEVFIDGVEGLTYGSFSYNALTLNKKDSKDEIAVADTATTVVTPTIYAQYHVSPSTAKLDDVKFAFDIQNDLEYIKTRAAASKDFAMEAAFEEFKDGILTVKVDITGLPADSNLISVFALQATADTVTVTSDYATLAHQDIEDVEIAYATKEDNHYRRAIIGINEDDEEAAVTVAAWADEENCDTTLVYTEELDLATIVAAHKLGEQACSNTAADLKSLGLEWKYEVVKNYEIGTPATPQDEFVSLNGSVIKAKVYETEGRAAIGRTPIIRVSLVDKNNDNAIVKCSYIKVEIVDEDEAPIPNESIELEVPEFVFNCDADTNAVTVKEINLKVYNELGLSFEQFLKKYPVFVDWGATQTPAHIGKVEATEQDGTTKTNVVEWSIEEDTLWAYAGEEISHTIRYYASEDTATANFVQFELTSKIGGVKKTYNVTSADFISNYWDAAKTYTKLNVAVPNAGDSIEAAGNCVFENNLNAPFTTWPANSEEGVPGILKLDKAITGIEYFFCADDVATIAKIGDYKTKFVVSEDGLNLWAYVGEAKDSVLVATITNNEASEEVQTSVANLITYNKEDSIAKVLLNTNEMYTFIGAKGYACDDTDKPVEITFDGKDHFQANYIRPVNIAEQAADNFIDAVDMGEKGSFIRLEDLIAPYDWRGREFSEYPNYWGYYGEFKITVDTTTALCDLNGATEPYAVPTTVVLEQKPAGTMGEGKDAKESAYGFLTYKNNGNNVSEFNVYVKVTVEYGWGVIVTDYIKVKVASTIAAE